MLKVSLGFSEFVSQLIHETFDAIVGSQFYQIEKYNEIRDALNTPLQMFREKYINDQEFNEFQVKIFGFTPSIGVVIDENRLSILNAFFTTEDLGKIISNGKINSLGLKKIIDICIIKIVEIKKNNLRQFINQTEKIKLKVESGEINTKLDLFCLNEENIDMGQKLSKDEKLKTKPLEKEKLSLGNVKAELKDKKFLLREIIDIETKQKIILIDKLTFTQSSDKKTIIPTARLVASPLGKSSATNLFSELKIKFSFQ